MHTRLVTVPVLVEVRERLRSGKGVVDSNQPGGSALLRAGMVAAGD